MKKNNLLVVLTSVVVVGVAVGLLFPTPAASANDCGAIQKWVQENAKRLPNSYSELSRYPTAYRRAIYATYAPGLRSKMWQSHFEAYLSRHPELRPDQTELLYRAIDLATPEFFAHASSEEARAHLELLREDMVRAFGVEESFAIIAQLGPADDGDIVSIYGGGGGICSCSTSSDWCGGSNHCKSGGCSTAENECGTWWSYNCNGHCYQNT